MLDVARCRPTVLVVEDECLLSIALDIVLSESGWNVLGPASSVEEALHLLGAARQVDAAVLDVNMRGGMVSPVADELRQREVPFVLSSACEPATLFEVEVLASAPRVVNPTDFGRLLTTLEEITAPADREA